MYMYINSITLGMATNTNYEHATPTALKMADVDSPMELGRSSSDEGPLKEGFYRVELNKTLWEVPTKYTELTPIGTGAYGSVW